MSRALDDDEPMTLAEACEVVFRGTIKPATLRAVTARGKMNSIRVVFEDGYVMITSGNSIRRRR